MKRKPEELLKYLAYTLSRLGMVKEATKLAKSNGTGTEINVLKELKDVIDKSVKACAAKKEVIEKLLNLQKDGKVAGKVSNLITKALMAPDEIFPKYLEKLELLEKSDDELEKAVKKVSPFEWKEEHKDQYGIGKQPYPFPKIADPDKVKGWKHVENHFVDSSGMGREGEAALTHEQFHAKLKPGRGYAITDAGQFQVNVGEYEKKDKKPEVKKSEDIEKAVKKVSPFEWKEEHKDQYGIGKQPYPFPKIADPDKVKGWKHVENHFVDKTGLGREDEPAWTIKAFHTKLKPGRGYAITDEGQFQVNVGEYEKEDKKPEVKKSSKNFEGLRNSVKEAIRNGMDPRTAISTYIVGSQIDLGEHGKLMDEFVSKEIKPKK